MKLLYLTQSAMDDAGSEASLRVFLALFDEASGKLVTIANLLNDSTKLSELVYEGFDLRLVKISTMINPLIVLGDNLPTGTEPLKIDAVYSQVTSALAGAERLAPQTESTLITTLTKILGGQKIAETTISCCYAFKVLTTTDLHIVSNFSALKLAPEFARQTQNWLNEQNRKNTMASIPDNETKFQQTCTSELFIKLPAYDAMFSYLNSSNGDDEEGNEQVALRDLHGFMPVRAEVSDPYGINAPQYENPVSVQKMIDTLHEKETNGERSPVLESQLREILGVSSNNTDEIFENEKRYYESLNKWMGLIAIESEGEDRGDLCDISIEYLHTLVETLYIWYWQHNKRVPCAIEVSSGAGVDADGNVAYDESKYTFKTNDSIGVATEELTAFLDRVAADCGREIYAKAAVQLARWGSRKPTEIVFDGYDKCFDLNGGYAVNAKPSLAKYTVVQSNGKDYKFAGFVKDISSIADQRIGFKQWPMPVGIALMQTFVDKSTNDTITIESFYSMIDAVREIVTGDLQVDGISYTDGNWSVRDTAKEYTTNEVIALAKQPERLQFPIFIGKGILQICATLRINLDSNNDAAKIRSTHFNLMNEKMQTSDILTRIDKNTFSSYAGLDTLTKECKIDRKTALNYMLVRDWLKVYHLAATRCENSSDGEEVFKLWHNAILDSGYVNEAYFYDGLSERPTPLPGCHVENFHKCFWHKDISGAMGTATGANSGNQTAVPKQMNFESKSEEGGVTATMNKVDFVSAIIMQPAPNCEYCQFVNESNEVVCTCAINSRIKHDKTGAAKKDPIFVVLDNATVASMNLPAGIHTYSVNRLIAHMCKAFFTMSKNSPVASNLRFANSDAIKEIYQYFKNLNYGM